MGYAGKLLRIDVGSRKIRVVDFPVAWRKKYLGGRGLGAYILFSELPPKIEPFSPENKIIIAPGPLCGLFIPGAGKTAVISKSPATLGYADSSVGGHFGPELKYAGFDAIIIEGASQDPVYLKIDDDAITIEKAEFIWNRGAIESEITLKKELGFDYKLLTIGQGGENLVKFAAIGSEHGRQAGRCGLGAILGSKKIKAIAVRGSKDIPIYDKEEFLEVVSSAFEKLKKHPELVTWQKFGTSSVIMWANETGCLPSHNFSSGVFKYAEEISGEAMRKKIVIGDLSCFGCPMSCGKLSKVKGKLVEGPEYETLSLLGSNCGIKNIETIALANYWCDEYGIDTISTGNVIAFAMECFERGIIDKKVTGGINLEFGNDEALLETIRLIAFRKGIGSILAEGVRACAEKFGKESYKFAMQVKNLEWSGYESRGAPGMALSYATADIGAHHNRAWVIAFEIQQGEKRFSTEGKAEKVIELQHIRPLFDCLGTCRLQWVELGLDLDYYSQLLNAATGWDFKFEDLLVISERIYNLTRAFNVREGFNRKEDCIPKRVMYEKMPNGAAKGHLVDEKIFEALLERYYTLRGWTKEGIPSKEKLLELGLDEVANELYKN